jgi:hypothetical protein
MKRAKAALALLWNAPCSTADRSPPRHGVARDLAATLILQRRSSCTRDRMRSESLLLAAKVAALSLLLSACYLFRPHPAPSSPSGLDDECHD